MMKNMKRIEDLRSRELQKELNIQVERMLKSGKYPMPPYPIRFTVQLKKAIPN